MDSAAPSQTRESRITFATAQGEPVQGLPLHVSRHRAVVTIHSPPALRLSEVLEKFTIVLDGQTLYTGKALITQLTPAGLETVCETALEEAWFDPGALAARGGSARMAERYQDFLKQWQRTCRIQPQYKAVIGDLHSYLSDLRLWLEHAGLGLAAPGSEKRAAQEREMMESMAPASTATITGFFDRFESAARGVSPEDEPEHQAFGRRLVTPLLLGSPFVFRTLRKPLGYAGDYEMVNMMLRDPFEGASLFAKTINVYALGLPPVVAHRNRIAYLEEKLVQENRRCLAGGTPARILNIGCGPACEIQRFIREDDFAGNARFTLVDFNDETLAYARRALEAAPPRGGRAPQMQMVRRSVQQILKQAMKTPGAEERDPYDFVYCAGLFDYLSDAVCKSLTAHLYRQLAPGGLLVLTNVDDHPSRREMEYFLEWHLLYRNAAQMRQLVPQAAGADSARVIQDPTGVNVFLEIRKPRLAD